MIHLQSSSSDQVGHEKNVRVSMCMTRICFIESVLNAGGDFPGCLVSTVGLVLVTN